MRPATSRRPRPSSRDGAVYGLLTVSASAEGIDQVLWVVAPEKIAAVAAPGQRASHSR